MIPECAHSNESEVINCRIRGVHHSASLCELLHCEPVVALSAQKPIPPGLSGNMNIERDQELRCWHKVPDSDIHRTVFSDHPSQKHIKRSEERRVGKEWRSG